MSFTDAVKAFYQNYADFSGRATRPEFWWALLYYLALSFLVAMISEVSPVFGMILVVVFLLTHIIPYLAMVVRRLHDSDKSGWLILVALIPFVGGIALIILLVQPTAAVSNQWGAPANL